MSTIAIVGAGPGLGMAIARRFAAEGFDVALIARSRTTLRTMVRELSESGVRAAAVPADVTDRPALRAALAAVTWHFGAIDILEFSPAPTATDMVDRPIVGAAELTVESLVPELEMYVLGGVTAVQAVLPDMLARGSGTILATTGAGSGPMIIPAVANAQVAAAGLRNWLLNLHAAVADRGVYVAHVALAAAIGQGRPDSEPEVIAEAYWRLHRERKEPELFYRDLPEDYVFEGLSDKFVAEW